MRGATSPQGKSIQRQARGRVPTELRHAPGPLIGVACALLAPRMPFRSRSRLAAGSADGVCHTRASRARSAYRSFSPVVISDAWHMQASRHTIPVIRGTSVRPRHGGRSVRGRVHRAPGSGHAWVAARALAATPCRVAHEPARAPEGRAYLPWPPVYDGGRCHTARAGRYPLRQHIAATIVRNRNRKPFTSVHLNMWEWNGGSARVKRIEGRRDGPGGGLGRAQHAAWRGLMRNDGYKDHPVACSRGGHAWSTARVG